MSSLNLNKVIFAGHLTANPEMKYTPSGKAVTSFTVASSHTWNSAEGERKKNTTFLRFEAWGKTAEAINQYFSKGRAIYVEGRIQIDKVEKEGAETQWYTKCVVETFKFVDSKGESDNGFEKPVYVGGELPDGEIPDEKDIPF